MVKEGFLGRKSGKGCYVYEGKGDRQVNQKALDIFKRHALPSQGFDADEDIQLRLVTRFVNEAVLSLQVRN